MDAYYSIRWINGTARMLDQRLLPHQEVYRDYTDYHDVASAITDMVIRGAPAIGAAAGFGMALAALNSSAKSEFQLLEDLKVAARELRSARPTAVNLSWAINKILEEIATYQNQGVQALKEGIVSIAIRMAGDDVRVNKQIGKNGAELLKNGANVIHHCNTGALATVGYGTALGVIRYAHEAGKEIHVFVDETRPRLQGARLTAWELAKLEIPHTVIVDGASGHIMRTQHIDMCIVGCDRIAANGDVANKIGTYNLALAAFAHQVPFYSAGPVSSFDLYTKSGDDIPIEERFEDEITFVHGCQITPDGTRVANPAFDITPAKYITGIITENGIASAPYEYSLPKLASRGAKS